MNKAEMETKMGKGYRTVASALIKAVSRNFLEQCSLYFVHLEKKGKECARYIQMLVCLSCKTVTGDTKEFLSQLKYQQKPRPNTEIERTRIGNKKKILLTVDT